MSKRLYRHNLVRYWSCYDLEGIRALFERKGLHIQTVRAWITKYGLKTIDKSKPSLVFGYDLIQFLKLQNDKGKCQTEFHEFYCMKCRDARPVFESKIQVVEKNGFIQANGHCRTCKSRMSKSYQLSDFQELKRTFYMVDVLELYDSANTTAKTHITDTHKSHESESSKLNLLGDLFDEKR